MKPWIGASLIGVILVLGIARPVGADLVPACLDDVDAADVPVRLRASKDSRVMMNHASDNDGGAGLLRIKNGNPVRGLVGFDLACLEEASPGALAQTSCASLELSVWKGRPRKGGATFHVHRLIVPWREGNQAYNTLKVNRRQLGRHFGTGEGVTWACRNDLDLAPPIDADCAPEDLWNGGDSGGVCGIGPCYDLYAGTPPAAQYLSKHQKTIAWDVTGDVRGFVPSSAPDDLSWLLKVADERVKSGSVKLFTREGALHMATYEGRPDSADRHELAPTLTLWGPAFSPVAAADFAPTAPVSEPEACLSFSGDAVAAARWRNRTTGAWGWMSEEGGCGPGFSASIALSTKADEQPNQIEITVSNACSQESTYEQPVTYQPAG